VECRTSRYNIYTSVDLFSIWFDLSVSWILASTLLHHLSILPDCWTTVFVCRLVGRTAASNRYNWLCGTNEATNKVFTRSLLAKVFYHFSMFLKIENRSTSYCLKSMSIWEWMKWDIVLYTVEGVVQGPWCENWHTDWTLARLLVTYSCWSMITFHTSLESVLTSILWQSDFEN
jgi:hypothetical protein